jgi:indolepyruvate ferredoxin oxidoreductase beta subunit
MAAAGRTTILIAAMGGEGGGVLSQWITTALEGAGWHVQYTAIPGVAQRTGATTYYIEAIPEAALSGCEPVLSLLPMPGKVDVAIVTELAEIARMIERGFVTPERTLLIGSTHRVYATSEKMAMADGRMPEGPTLEAAHACSRSAVLADFAALAREAGAVINATVYGAFARVNPLALDRSGYVRAMGESAANMRGFELGWAAAGGEPSPVAPAPPEAPGTPSPFAARVAVLPPEARPIVGLAVARLIDFQDTEYATLFLDRLDSIGVRDGAFLAETARHLANRMAYHDIARVAQLKRDPERIAAIAAAQKPGPNDVVAIAEFFSPGPDEIAAMLPPAMAARVRAWADRKNRRERFSLPLTLKTTSAHGQIVLGLLARLKRRRRASARYAHEQREIEAWLEAVRRAAAVSPLAGREAAGLARLLKGYGETADRGSASFIRIVAVLPQVLNGPSPDRVLSALKAAALADPEGRRLSEALVTFALREPA